MLRDLDDYVASDIDERLDDYQTERESGRAVPKHRQAYILGDQDALPEFIGPP